MLLSQSIFLPSWIVFLIWMDGRVAPAAQKCLRRSCFTFTLKRAHSQPFGCFFKNTISARTKRMPSNA